MLLLWDFLSACPLEMNSTCGPSKKISMKLFTEYKHYHLNMKRKPGVLLNRVPLNDPSDLSQTVSTKKKDD